LSVIAYQNGDTAKCEALYIEAKGKIKKKGGKKHLPHYQLGIAKRRVFARVERALAQREIRLRK
jgi:hypothetical protein